jgi:hypothetical protein
MLKVTHFLLTLLFSLVSSICLIEMNLNLAEREGNCFRELTHVILEVGKAKMCRTGRQSRDPGRVDIAAHVGRLSRGTILSSLGSFSFLSFKALK